jgi:hypothetical protein
MSGVYEFKSAGELGFFPGTLVEFDGKLWGVLDVTTLAVGKSSAGDVLVDVLNLIRFNRSTFQPSSVKEEASVRLDAGVKCSAVAEGNLALTWTPA